MLRDTMSRALTWPFRGALVVLRVLLIVAMIPFAVLVALYRLSARTFMGDPCT